jgi:glycosyltransferase involved in cell wall biosynthesis
MYLYSGNIAPPQQPARRAPTRTASPPDRPLRILTALNSFELGGVERVALRLIAMWQATGIDARLVMSRAEGAMMADHQHLAYGVLERWPMPMARWDALRLIVRLPSIIRQLRPDVLFCPGNTYTLVAVAMKLILGSHCPAIVAKISNDLVRHDLHPIARRGYRWWLRIQARLIDRFVALSPAMADEINALMKVPFDRIDVIADPVLTVDDAVRLGTRKGKPRNETAGTVFAAIGRLARQKNVGVAIAAFARQRRPGDTLVLVGDGPERARLEQLADRLGVADDVAFVGHSDAVWQWFDRIDVLVVSSDYEGLPAVVVEALAAGKPIVATDCTSSMADLLDHGRFGILVPRRDVPALATAMRDAAETRFDSDGARRAARGHTLEHGSVAYVETMMRQCAVRRAVGRR